MSFRGPRDSTKTFVDQPEFSDVDALLEGIESGEVECVTIYGPQDEMLCVLGRPGLYHLTLFVDETDGYAFNDGSGDTSKIDIAGEYWPSFRVCRDKQVLIDAARRFYASGDRPNDKRWQHFSND
jgi:hypothetical protein